MMSASSANRTCRAPFNWTTNQILVDPAGIFGHNTHMTKVQAHQIAVVSDLHQYGRRFDDGSPIIDERFFVQYEDDRGYRWRHRVYFDSVMPEPDDDDGWGGPQFHFERERARQHAEHLADRICQAGIINLEHWQTDRPAYGSLAWQESGQDAIEIMHERMEDEHGY